MNLRRLIASAKSALVSRKREPEAPAPIELSPIEPSLVIHPETVVRQRPDLEPIPATQLNEHLSGPDGWEDAGYGLKIKTAIIDVALVNGAASRVQVTAIWDGRGPLRLSYFPIIPLTPPKKSPQGELAAR